MKRSLLIILAALTISLSAYSADSTFIDLDGDFLLDLVVDDGASSTVYLGSTFMKESVVVKRDIVEALLEAAMRSVQGGNNLPLNSKYSRTASCFSPMLTTSLKRFSPSDVNYEFALRDTLRINSLYTTSASQFLIEDVDLDGRKEWLFWEKLEQWDTVATMYVYENSFGDVWLPEDTLTTPACISGDYAPSIVMNGMVAADFDQDGCIEVYFEGGDDKAWIYKWRGERDVEIFASSLILGTGIGSTYVADWENNGVPNIIAVRYSSSTDQNYDFNYLHIGIMEYHSIIQYDEEYQMFVFGNYKDFTYNWGEGADYAFEGAVGDIDNDGQNEIVLNRVWGHGLVFDNNLLHYVDVNTEGIFEVKEIICSTPGYNYTPLIGDVDNDGLNEWLSFGLSMLPDYSTELSFRIIECDEEGNPSETFFDTSSALATSHLRAATLTDQDGTPTLVSASEWYDPNEVRPDTVWPTEFLAYSLIEFRESAENVMIVSSDYSHIAAYPHQLLYDDLDGDGRMNLYLGSRSGDYRLITLEHDHTTGSSSSEVLLPGMYELGTPYPNPFNSRVNVTVTLPQPSVSKIQVFDLLGRQVAQIPVPATAGVHRISWDATRQASGVYFLRWDALENQARRIVLVK